MALEEAALRIGKPSVDKPDPARGVVQVIVPVEGHMPDEWYAIMVEGSPGITLYSDLPELRFGDGSAVSFTCAPDSIQRFVTHVAERVEAANRIYNTKVLPTLRAEKEATEKRDAEHDAERERLLRDANRAIDELPG